MNKTALSILGFIVILVIIGGFAYYLYAGRGGSSNELVIYVYSDFMAWGEHPNQTWAKVFDAFGQKYHVKVKVRTFDDARTALLAAINEYKRGVRTADLIIGVDNLLIHEARKAGIIQCYYSPVAEKTVPEDVAKALDPEKCVTPIDYGLIAIVYDPSRLPANITSILAKPTLEDLAKPSIASRLIVEDPTKSSPGLAFLFWEIGVSEKLEGKNWTAWWEKTRNYLYVAPSWGKAYDEFLRKGSTRAIVVSYGTDPAYSAWENKGEPTLKATLIYYNGKPTAWLQVEGALVVKGQPGTKLAEKFVDWLLSPEIQSLIPSNQWMLPANSKVQLPSYYKYALTLKDAEIVVNNLYTPDEISKNYENWLLTWTQLMASK